MRRGRQVDRLWKVLKYKDDIALYAHCKCGFDYCCSSSKRNEDGSWSVKQYIDPYKFYHYCPNCGAHKKWYTEEVYRIDKFRYQ